MQVCSRPLISRSNWYIMCNVFNRQGEVCSLQALRKHYVDELIRRQHNGLVKILTGIRRCGKSYLLSVLFKDYLLQQGVPEDHIIEIPLDRDDHRNLCDAIKLGEYIRSKIIPDGNW